MTDPNPDPLAGIRPLPNPHVSTDSELAASRRRIALRIAAEVAAGRADLEDTALTMHPAWVCTEELMARDRPPAGLPSRDRASRQLAAWCGSMLRSPEAADQLALLLNDRRRIDPDGAVAFGCLLYLTGMDEAAQFWWQFAAGDDNPDAAFCLHLYHLGYGEADLAAHWDRRARNISAPPPASPACRILTDALARAVRHLDSSEDEDFGDIPHPDPQLAEQLKALAAS